MHKLPIRWDARTLKDHAKAAAERAQDLQAEQDWNAAAIYAERGVSDLRKRFAICPLPARRRARACRGNPTICLPPSAARAAEGRSRISICRSRSSAAPPRGGAKGWTCWCR
jgi:hypothetical protein